MDYLEYEENDLALFCRGKRRVRVHRNRDNPPKCRRQLFEKSDPENDCPVKEEDTTKEQQSPVKDWVTCLKSCLDFEYVTSLNQFQSYLQFMNSFENQTEKMTSSNNADTSQQFSQIIVDSETGKDFVVLNNVKDDSFEARNNIDEQNILVYLNNTNNCVISPNIEITHDGGNYYTDVMLSSEDISEDEDVISSWVITDTPSCGLYCDDVMGSDEFEVDHEEVVQCLSGSFDTLSCHSDDFSGNDEGFPDDFMDDE
ncbi:hypothetical protein SNE40_013372 [Patella caerulea]|uniref:Uncharacterized protein n=1 Tax=Patella caerulea TaxID=87958 RepID=A0AAN8PGU8_PATCE